MNMTWNLPQFLVHKYRYAQSNPAYADALVLREYLAEKNEDAEAAFVCDMVEQMCELRFAAEEKFRKTPRIAYNSREELLLDVGSMVDILTSKNVKEPPLQLISVIAQHDYPLILQMTQALRKVLQRKRDMLPLGQIQQLDAHCLRWISRRPGRNAVEKAGSEQKLMAVVREESHNTLENRVFKDFLCRAKTQAARYIKRYGEKYPNSDRVKAVRRLLILVSSAVQAPELKPLLRLSSLPQPNYVLLHDARYNKIWELYRKLLANQKIVEMVWEKRHVLFSDICRIWLAMILRLKKRPLFECSLWFRILPQNGSFLVRPRFTNVYDLRAGLLQWIEDVNAGELILKLPHKERRIRFAYVPGAIQPSKILIEPADTTIVFSPHPVSMNGNFNTCWVSDILELEERLQNIIKEMGI